MLPEAWPGWVPWIIGAGAVAAALLSVIALALKLKAAADWFAKIVRHEVGEIVDARLAPIAAEIKPNGGSSMNDKITRIDRAVVHLATWAARHDPEGYDDHPRRPGGGSSVEGTDDEQSG